MHQYIGVISQWLLAVADVIVAERPETEFAMITFGDFPGEEFNHSTEPRPVGWIPPKTARPREVDIAQWGQDP